MSEANYLQTVCLCGKPIDLQTSRQDAYGVHRCEACLKIEHGQTNTSLAEMREAQPGDLGKLIDENAMLKRQLDTQKNSLLRANNAMERQRDAARRELTEAKSETEHIRNAYSGYVKDATAGADTVRNLYRRACEQLHDKQDSVKVELAEARHKNDLSLRKLESVSQELGEVIAERDRLREENDGLRAEIKRLTLKWQTGPVPRDAWYLYHTGVGCTAIEEIDMPENDRDPVKVRDAELDAALQKLAEEHECLVLCMDQRTLIREKLTSTEWRADAAENDLAACRQELAEARRDLARFDLCVKSRDEAIDRLRAELERLTLKWHKGPMPVGKLVIRNDEFPNSPWSIMDNRREGATIQDQLSWAGPIPEPQEPK